jgi:hypothetical protein
MVTRFLEKRTAEIIILSVIIMVLMTSCGSSKQFHIGTGDELGKSRCSGNYVHGRN